MADFKQAAKVFRDLANELEEKIPLIVIGTNVTAKSLVQNRIQETGKDKDGKQLGNYSETKVPAFFYFGKGKKTTDSKVKKNSREKKPLSYKQFRELDGKQSKYVDLTFTGKMWQGIGLIQENKGKGFASFKIGPKDARTAELAAYNEARYGNFLALSDEEVTELSEDIQFEIENIINRAINF